MNSILITKKCQNWQKIGLDDLFGNGKLWCPGFVVADSTKADLN